MRALLSLLNAAHSSAWLFNKPEPGPPPATAAQVNEEPKEETMRVQEVEKEGEEEEGSGRGLHSPEGADAEEWDGSSNVSCPHSRVEAAVGGAGGCHALAGGGLEVAVAEAANVTSDASTHACVPACVCIRIRLCACVRLRAMCVCVSMLCVRVYVCEIYTCNT